MRALGTIIESAGHPLDRSEIHSGLLDYYDHWDSIDPRLAAHHQVLSRAADIFGHDLVNLATYAHSILEWLPPERICEGASVVAVGSLTEAFLVSARSACDAVGAALAYVGSSRPSLAPQDSLRSLLVWAKKNPNRVRPEVAAVLSDATSWFWALRTLRDHLVHGGAHATIHCTGRQFNLWMHSPKTGWVTREPLLPILASTLSNLLALADRASTAINQLTRLPPDRVGSRVVSGVYISALHELREVAVDYAEPSP